MKREAVYYRLFDRPNYPVRIDICRSNDEVKRTRTYRPTDASRARFVALTRKQNAFTGINARGFAIFSF